MPSPDITHTEQGDRLVVRVSGAMRLADAEEFDPHIEDVMARDAEVVVLDLSELDSIGSAGIGAMVRLAKAARDGGVRLRVVAATEIESIFKQSKLDEVFPMFRSVDDALA